MIGIKIGRLTITSFLGLKERPGARGKKAKYWECICECGNRYQSHTNALNSGRIKTCGKCKKISLNFKGYKDLGNWYVRQIIRHANKCNRKVDDTINSKTLYELLEKQNFRCAISGLKITVSRCKNDGQTASLDRIDSSKGYTIDNIQWLHKDINRLKTNFDQKRFLELCKLVTNNNIDVSLFI